MYLACRTLVHFFGKVIPTRLRRCPVTHILSLAIAVCTLMATCGRIIHLFTNAPLMHITLMPNGMKVCTNYLLGLIILVFLVWNCGKKDREFFIGHPDPKRNNVSVPPKGVHFFAGDLPWGAKTMTKNQKAEHGRMPHLVFDVYKSDQSEAQRTKAYAEPTIGKDPMFYNPYQFNHYLCTQDRADNFRNFFSHTCHSLRPGGLYSMTASGEGALKLIAINALAQSYEKKFDMRHLGTDQAQFHTGLTDGSNGEDEETDIEDAIPDNPSNLEPKEHKEQPMEQKELPMEQKEKPTEQKEQPIEVDGEEKEDEENISADENSIVGKDINHKDDTEQKMGELMLVISLWMTMNSRDFLHDLINVSSHAACYCQ